MFIAKLVKTEKAFFPNRTRIDKHWLDLSNQQFEPDKRLNVLRPNEKI